MKYPYISIMPVIAELQTQLSVFYNMGKIDDDDCINYALQCLRMLNVHSYEQYEVVIEVKKHKAIAPKHVYLISSLKVAEKVNTAPNSFFYTGANGQIYVPTESLYPVDSNTLSYVDGERFEIPRRYRFKFSFKQPPGIIQTDLANGCLYLKYATLKRNEQGELMIQDEENCIEALKLHITKSVLWQEYLLQKIPRYIYADVEVKYQLALSNAQNAMLELNASEVDNLVEESRHSLDRFKL